VLVARVDLDAAKRDLAEARWLARLRAQRRVEHAANRLDDLLDEGRLPKSAVGGPR
jgi:hypothetical protein